MINPEEHRDAVVACATEAMKVHQATAEHNVRRRKVQEALLDLEEINKTRIESNQETSLQNENRNQVCRWASKCFNVTLSGAFADFDLKNTLVNTITKAVRTKDSMEEHGVDQSQLCVNHRPLLLKELRSKLRLNNPIDLRTIPKMHERGKIRIETIEGAASNVLARLVKPGRKPLLMPDEETLLVAKAEMSAAASALVNPKRPSDVIASTLEKSPSKKQKQKQTANHDAKLRHARNVIRWVNAKEPEATNQRKRSTTAEVEVSALSRH